MRYRTHAACQLLPTDWRLISCRKNLPNIATATTYRIGEIGICWCCVLVLRLCAAYRSMNKITRRFRSLSLKKLANTATVTFIVGTVFGKSNSTDATFWLHVCAKRCNKKCQLSYSFLAWEKLLKARSPHIMHRDGILQETNA